MVAEARPLAGRRIVVTRPEHQADEMVATLRQLGAEPVEIPAIRIQPKADLSALDEALRHVERYQWLVFTSTNGVRIALDRLEELGLDLGRLANSRIAAIGPATAGSLRERGLEANFVPESFVAEEVAADLPEVDGARVLLPRAAGARAVLPEQLEARGAVVDEIAIYESVPADVNPPRYRAPFYEARRDHLHQLLDGQVLHPIVAQRRARSSDAPGRSPDRLHRTYHSRLRSGDGLPDWLDRPAVHLRRIGGGAGEPL